MGDTKGIDFYNYERINTYNNTLINNSDKKKFTDLKTYFTTLQRIVKEKETNQNHTEYDIIDYFLNYNIPKKDNTIYTYFTMFLLIYYFDNYDKSTYSNDTYTENSKIDDCVQYEIFFKKIYEIINNTQLDDEMEDKSL